MKIDEELAIKVATLSRRAPQEWGEFLKAFDAYVEVRKEECIRAPLDMLQVTQGRAQNSATVLDLFRNAVSIADRIAIKAQK